MEIEKYLKEFEKETCACGRRHLFTVSRVIVEKGAIEKLPNLIQEQQARKHLF